MTQSDPNHSWTAGRAQRDHGFLAPDANEDLLPIGYYEGADLPFTQQFVQRFTTFDDYHASLLGPTYPNRDYLHSRAVGRPHQQRVPDRRPTASPSRRSGRSSPPPNVPANYYYSDLPFLSLFGPRMTPFIRTIDDYYEQCASGDAAERRRWSTRASSAPGQNDDHPLADVRAGQAFQRNVFKAFAESPQWERGAVHLHLRRVGRLVRPRAARALPRRPRERRRPARLLPGRLPRPDGARVAVRPPGLVDHRTYDHTSILRFLEWRFLGAPPEGPGQAGDSWFLTRRDRYAANLGASLSHLVRTWRSASTST